MTTGLQTIHHAQVKGVAWDRLWKVDCHQEKGEDELD